MYPSIHPYIHTYIYIYNICILLEDMFLFLENLLTNPVILKCILWEGGLVKSFYC